MRRHRSRFSAHNTVGTPLAPGSATFQSTPAKTEPEQRSAFIAPAAKSDPGVTAQPIPTPAVVPQKLADTASSASVGTVLVTSDPDGAEIFVDSVGYGHAPAILKLSPGKHSIQLVTQGYKDWTAALEVRENSIVNVTAKLEK